MKRNPEKLLAYALCEEAIASERKYDPDNSPTFLRLFTKHGYNPKRHRCPGDFLDELRRVALGKRP